LCYLHHLQSTLIFGNGICGGAGGDGRGSEGGCGLRWQSGAGGVK